jgi:hypothetical protein
MNRTILRQLVQEILYSTLAEEETPINPEPQPEVEITPPAPAPATPSGEITLDQAKQLILNTGRANGGKGGFFTVSFVEKDGTLRVMNARLDVKKYLKGGKLKYDARARGYIPAYDMVNKGYRMINSNTITALNIGNKRYTVSQDIPQAAQQAQQQAAQETSPEVMEEIKRMRKLANIK